MSEVLEILGNLGVVPVVTIERAGDATQLGQALLKGGLPCVEVLFRTTAATEAIRRLASGFPDMLVGSGTVLSREQAELAVGAGARFIVSPGFDAEVVDWCLEHNIPVTPGVVTPTEVNIALAKGLRILKFFPAEAMGGMKVLKAIGGPYRDVKFIPTGGINAATLADYLSLPVVHACGGSWMVERRLISAGEFDEITRRVQEAVTIVQQVRG